MDKYVVRQAIKDLNHHIIGYELLFENEADGAQAEDSGKAAARAIINFLEQSGRTMFEDKVAFITFVPNLLLKSIPKIFDETKIVIQIDDSVLASPTSYDALMKFKERNYRIAIKDFQFAPRFFAVLGIADFIGLNFGNLAEAKLSYDNIIKTAKGFNKKCLAYGVDNKEAYSLAVRLGVDYFEGTYLDGKITEKVSKAEYINSNFFRLVVEITKEDPSYDELEAIISRDVALTFSLLRLVNSAFFALRQRATSIMQALVILGVSGLKQWIYLLSFKQEQGDMREDLMMASFLRANFCSELLPCTDILEISKSEAYLMGMFSTLDVLMGAPLEDLLADIMIAEEVKAALLHNEGKCGLLYNLVLSYEKADWKKINEYAEQLRVPKDRIAQIYFNCIEVVNSTWEAFRITYGENNNG